MATRNLVEVSTYVTIAERKKIDKKWRSNGNISRSDYVRQVLREKIK